MLWVAAGGACGALLRYAVQSAAAGALPWGTFVVNVVGCLGIGALLAAFSGSPWFEAVGRSFLVLGVLGAFTTFSAFSADTLVLYDQGGLLGRWLTSSAPWRCACLPPSSVSA